MPYTITWKDGSQTQMDDNEFAELPKEMEKDIGNVDQIATTPKSPSSYQFQPGQRKSLMDSIHEVGYSGLSDDMKELYKQQYDASEYAKAGHTFEEAIKVADESAKSYDPNFAKQSTADQELARQMAEKYGNEGGNAYTLGRDILSIPVGAVMSTAEYAKDRLFGEGGWAADKKPWTEYFKEALELGNKGEGATGFFAEPTQVASFGLPVSTAASLPVRALQEGVKGAGLAGTYSLGTGNTDNLIRDMLIGGALGGGIGALTSKPTSVQIKQEQEALRTFPGDTYFRTQKNKGAEVFEAMSDAEKKEILRSIPEPYNKEAWIRYYEGISDKARAGYEAADEIAKTYKGMPGAEIPMSELKAKMIENMEKGVGQYSKKDAERFVKNRLAGFEDKYGANGKVPVHELGLIKGKFTEDIFDPRFSVAEGTATKRALAKKAGSTIEDYRAKRPAYLDENPMPQGSTVSDFDEMWGKLSEIEKTELRDKMAKVYEQNALPYNTLLERVSPGTKDLYRRGQQLEDIFQHQAENIGSQRIGKGLFGKLFEGAKHTYGPSGNAYIDPVRLLQKSESAYPKVIGGLGTLGAFDLGRALTKDITSSYKEK